MKLRLAVLLLFTAPAAFAASADLRAFFNYGDTPVHPGLPFPVDVIYLNLSETTAVDTRLTLLIDGLTQARYFADANPAGPEIELRGSSLTEGDGLVIAVPCEATVQGLAITGFPRHALYLTSTAPCPAQGYVRSGHQIRQNYLGVDASGTTAVPNLRGIYSDGGLPPRIEENVISGNTRAGVFMVSGAVLVRGNTIGLDPTGTRPLGNGASGIYFGAAAGGSEATGNHIAFNHEAGVAVDASARYVTVHRNAIHANYQTAIDHGLDGPTPALPIAAPEITSARYDAAINTTTILMTLPPPQVTESYSTSIDVYANDAPDPTGFGEAQTYLGTATFLAGVPQLTYRGDLRGKAIAAQAILRTFTETDGSFTTSSEIGRALAVTE